MENRMLKCDFHAHTSDDPCDIIAHSGKQLIDEYARQNFDVVAITLHGKVHSSRKLQAYSRKKGILLVPGAEGFIDGKDAAEGKHVLFLNATQKEVDSVRSIRDLRNFRKRLLRSKKPFLVIAPHPFYILGSCLGSLLGRNPDCFDAVEYSHFYPSFFNAFNRKAERFAEAHGKPVVGMGDVHTLLQVGWTYTLVDSRKNVPAVLAAIKSGKSVLKTRPLPFFVFLRLLFFLFIGLARVKSQHK